jgi:hypothetical protein
MTPRRPYRGGWEGGGRHLGTDYLQLAARLGAGRALSTRLSTQEILAAIDDILRG